MKGVFETAAYPGVLKAKSTVKAAFMSEQKMHLHHLTSDGTYEALYYNKFCWFYFDIFSKLLSSY